MLKVEYTVPATPAAPMLAEAARVADDIQFSFSGESGLTYSVEYTSDLASTNWTTLTNIPALPGSAIVQIFDSLKPAKRFYRARTP